MQAKLKLIYYYLSLLILTILFLALVLLIVFKTTILSPNYVLKQFEKNNYYHELYQNIETEMTYYVDQSGLEDSVVTGIVDEDTVRDEVVNLINSLYRGEKATVTTSPIIDKIQSNINDYLTKHHLTAKDEDINLFLKEMEDVYVNKITFNDKLSSFSNIIVKTNKLLASAIIGLTVVTVIFFLISKFICHKYILPVPLMSTALLIFLGNFLLKSNISIEHIVFWNDSVSKVIRSTILNITTQTIIWAIVLILLSFGLTFVKVLNKKSK